MAGFFADGRIADLILALIALETIAILAMRLITGRGPALSDVIGTMLSGLFLVLALRAALEGAAWIFVASPLAAALAAHIVDLRSRWPRRAPCVPAHREASDG